MKKKALIVANLAGFASFLYNDFDILNALGYEITYSANPNKLKWDDTKQKLKDRGIKFIPISLNSKNPFSSENIQTIKELKKILSSEHYDLIHCHTPIVGALVRFLANKYRRKGSKVVYTTHGLTFHQYASKKDWFIYYPIEMICSLFCDAIITINNEDYTNAKKMFCKHVYQISGVGVQTSKISSVEIDRDSYRESIGISKGDILVMSVGELSPRKNHRVIIEALSTIANKEKYVYAICGNGVDGGTGQELTSLADSKGVRLKLLGFRHDIAQLVHCADIGALPSLREGLGLSGIESLSAGVPVVGADVQGIRDYIIEGVTGYRCNPNRPSEFKEAIEKLASLNQKEILLMNENCKLVSKKFDTEVSRQQVKKIYQDLLTTK